jgi:hypothetical protein
MFKVLAGFSDSTRLQHDPRSRWKLLHHQSALRQRPGSKRKMLLELPAPHTQILRPPRGRPLSRLGSAVVRQRGYLKKM